MKPPSCSSFWNLKVCCFLSITSENTTIRRFYDDKRTDESLVYVEVQSDDRRRWTPDIIHSAPHCEMSAIRFLPGVEQSSQETWSHIFMNALPAQNDCMK